MRRQDIGAGLKGYIMDLRGNPGGLLDQSVRSVRSVHRVTAASCRPMGGIPTATSISRRRAGDIADGLPVVVLVNGDSASAAEIVAAALQDSGRGGRRGQQLLRQGHGADRAAHAQ